MLINAIANQKVYPKAGDVDDCWVVATWMAAKAVRPDIPKSDVTWLRGAAGDPDDGKTDGGNTQEVYRMCRRMWPDIRVIKINGHDAGWLKAKLQGSLRPVSLAVWSARLPGRYRFGFGGAHQVVVWWEDGNFWIANPLAPDGDPPMKIAWSDVRYAAYGMTTNRTVVGVLFPSKEEAAKTWKRFNTMQVDIALNAAVEEFRKQIENDEMAVQTKLNTLKGLIEAAYAVVAPADEPQDPI